MFATSNHGSNKFLICTFQTDIIQKVWSYITASIFKNIMFRTLIWNVSNNIIINYYNILLFDKLLGVMKLPSQICKCPNHWLHASLLAFWPSSMAAFFLPERKNFLPFRGPQLPTVLPNEGLRSSQNVIHLLILWNIQLFCSKSSFNIRERLPSSVVRSLARTLPRKCSIKWCNTQDPTYVKCV